jgi:DNA-binding NtrC family response regulator
VTAIAPAALQRLQGYAWPGNVRELRNVIERAVLLADGETIDTPHLPEGLSASEKISDTVPSLTLPLGITIDEAERTLILQSLKLAGHNKTRAAAILGITSRRSITS